MFLAIIPIMKIAIPLFNMRISPRLDCAQSFLVATVEKGKVVERKELQARLWTPLKRIEKLRDAGVDTLICGGLDEVSAGRLISYRIRTYSWVTGGAEEAIYSLLRGELESGIMVGPGGRRRGRWRLKGNNGQCGIHQRGQGKGRGWRTLPRILVR